MNKLDGFLGGQVAHGSTRTERERNNAFDATPLDCVNVVILGRDPYPHKGLATASPPAVLRTTPSR